MSRRGYVRIPHEPSDPDRRASLSPPLRRREPSPYAVRGRSVGTINSVATISSRLSLDIARELQAEQDAHAGVQAAEAAEQLGLMRAGFACSIALASYVYSLDNQTTSNYLPFATSFFGAHSFISSIQVAQSIIVACGKPVIAKVADVTSRATAFIVVLLFYVTGYLVIATAFHVGFVALGIICYAIGLQLLTSVIIADITTLKWRGLVSGMTSIPFLFNAIIGSKLADAVLKPGDAMFAILVPAALLPLILTLFWGERKAKQLGLVETPPPGEDIVHHVKAGWAQRAWLLAEQLDLVGLLLLATAVACILLPMTLARKGKSSWADPSMVAMFVCGWVLLPVFVLWDLRYAKRPVIAMRFLANRTVVCAAWIGFFDFLSFFLTFTYLQSFVLVTKPWSMTNVFYFGQAQTVGLTLFGIAAGIIMRFTHRYKPLLIIGLCIRIAGVALMIHARSDVGTDASLVWTQVLQGLGGGFAAVCSSVGAQASVPHADVAMVIALVLLWTEIGGGVGGSVAGGIWAAVMPGKLKEKLPELSEAERAALFGSITDVRKRPLSHPVRAGVVAAYSDTMEIMVVVATVLSVIPLALSFLMPDWYLGDAQNAVEELTVSADEEPYEDVL
ncbi:MFS general substrate transporter [Epithele typhae]|uniref:MFS general substrate transporter n=1 Tax=Epithele typhae TaxID=378194 RepID=UPI00200858CE|nr:MFS general substrate transporter [Epithele typhae]KAH9912103.1 MFS general substrate transporter [Epithele typhae]